MGFIDDIKEGKPSTIIIILLGIFVFHLYWTRESKEPMADVGNLDQIKEAVKQVYMADVEAIRNLSNVASKLQAGGLTVPGQLKVGGKISTNNLDPANMPDGWGGGLRIFDGYSSGTMGFGPDGKKLNAYINANGDLKSINANIDNAVINNNLSVNNNLNVKDSLKLGSWTVRENKAGHLVFIKDGTKYDDDYGKIPQDTGFIVLSPDGNIWANRSSGRGWLADNKLNVDQFNNFANNIAVRKDKKYGLQSSRGGYISDQGGWKGRPSQPGHWEVMRLDELPF